MPSTAINLGEVVAFHRPSSEGIVHGRGFTTTFYLIMHFVFFSGFQVFVIVMHGISLTIGARPP